MEWFWTDAAFFSLWKILNAAVLFCIYVPVPLWCGYVALSCIFNPSHRKLNLDTNVTASIVLLLWFSAFAIYHDPEPRRTSYTSIDGSQHYRFKDTIESNMTASFKDYLVYKRREQPVPVTVISMNAEIRQFELLDWTKPKHVYVELRDVKSDLTYKHVYVSKHCNNAREFRAHDMYNLNVDIVTYSDAPNEKRLKFRNLYDSLCAD